MDGTVIMTIIGMIKIIKPPTIQETIIIQVVDEIKEGRMMIMAKRTIIKEIMSMTMRRRRRRMLMTRMTVVMEGHDTPSLSSANPLQPP